MKPINFEGSNHTLGKPVDWTDAQCGSLHVFHGIDPHGNPFVSSMWMPSEADKKAISEGRPVMLTISAPVNHCPPASVWTYDEEGNMNDPKNEG